MRCNPNIIKAIMDMCDVKKTKQNILTHNRWNISHICVLVVSHKRLLKKPLVGNSTNLLAFAAFKEGHLFFF